MISARVRFRSSISVMDSEWGMVRPSVIARV